MSTNQTLTKFTWDPQPDAQALLDFVIADFKHRCPAARELARRMRDRTGTRFKDWIDSIEVPGSPEFASKLAGVGFTPRPLPGAPEVFVHEGAMFPAVLLGTLLRVAIKVDSVTDYLAANHLTADVVGHTLGQYRAACVAKGKDCELWVVERHGWRGFEAPSFDPARAVAAQMHLDRLRTRRREFTDAQEGYAHTTALVQDAVRDIGVDWTCDIFFEAERRFWQSRNRAAQVQKGRQDRLGLGWANHDHHTYRCSRETFKAHVALLETLGFHCRESFYAGSEAGWGAQVMEQPVTGIITFNDVDMSAEELMGDFAHEGLASAKGGLGTVGLWCSLHGESMLQAGMHHLECQFDFHAWVEQLESTAGVKTMAPFTTFPFLRQAFTEGERWPVNPARVDKLLKDGVITRLQAELFKQDGALGSHLENLERNDGFKGFNQKGVSDIIRRTDPRKQAALSGA